MNTVDLFSGAGGLSLGFEQAGFDTLLAVELDEKASKTYRHNIAAPCLNLDLSDSPELPISKKHVDVLSGGPPCQGFSIAGKRDDADERNELVHSFIEYVDMLEPEWVLMENVPGILSMGDTIEQIHEQFSSYGYKSEHQVLDATDFGVPQNRQRVFVMGARTGTPTFPKPTTNVSPTVDDALGQHSGCPNITEPKHQQKTIDRIADTDTGEPLYDSYTQRIRLDPNEPSPTLVCGGPRPQWQQAHPYENRGLTVRERASIQTFPDWYEFKGGVVSGRVQTGNAVPPKMAKAVAECISRNSS